MSADGPEERELESSEAAQHEMDSQDVREILADDESDLNACEIAWSDSAIRRLMHDIYSQDTHPLFDVARRHMDDVQVPPIIDGRGARVIAVYKLPCGCIVEHSTQGLIEQCACCDSEIFYSGHFVADRALPAVIHLPAQVSP